MIIVSSLTPSHANASNQATALLSWKDFAPCYSLNSKKEIDKLTPLYEGATFIETHRTVEQLFGKPLVTINAIIDFAIEKDEDLLMVNSDIILKSLPKLNQDGITIISRFDYTSSFGICQRFEPGFDAVFIPKKYLKLYPPSIYALGLAFWDYEIPYLAMLANVKVYHPQRRNAYHKLHATQYSIEEWNYIGAYFKWQYKMDKEWSIPQVATHTYNHIKSKLIHI